MNGSGKIQQPTRYLPHLIVADVREHGWCMWFMLSRSHRLAALPTTTYRVSFGVLLLVLLFIVVKSL